MVCKDYKKELELGKKIEMEHAHNFPKNMQEKIAEEVARDHLKEFCHYYSKGLIPLEKKLKGGK